MVAIKFSGKQKLKASHKKVDSKKCLKFGTP